VLDAAPDANRRATRTFTTTPPDGCYLYTYAPTATLALSGL
jgi:hypothetical protein